MCLFPAMSNRCAYILLKIVVGVGLLLIFAGFMSQKVFAQPSESPADESAATQGASEEEKASGETKKTDKLPFGKNDGKFPLPTKDNAGPDTSALLRQMLVLVVIILVLGGGCWFVMKKGLPRFRMAGSSTRPRDISVLETTYLPSRQTLYLVQVGAKKLLLASGKDGLQMLADVTDGFPETPTDEEFRNVLDKQDDGLDGGQTA
jgi:flagellar biogenesis protein FliO